MGAVWTLYQISRKLNISKALGSSREAKLVQWLIMSTLLSAKSRLSAVRLADRHAVCDVLGLESFNEDDLYAAMDWLDNRQSLIEKTLYKLRYGNRKPLLYLYDVTSTYMEGIQNLMAMFGYNRDGKKGKMQLVIGLLTDDKGWPISIQVFDGNTNDPKTVKYQITKLINQFGVEKAVFVGDRGMIKSDQITLLNEAEFYYITAITKPQIEALIKKDIFQLELFEEQLCEVTIEAEIEENAEDSTGAATVPPVKRYILRRNPQHHPKSWVSKALKDSMDKATTLKIDKWATVVEKASRRLEVQIDDEQKMKTARLDGCYVITSDVPLDQASATVLHDRYKDLKEVEWAFRTMKTTLIEMRGVYVRTKPHTRAHVFTVMLAYQIAYELRRKWSDIELTVEEGLEELSSIDSIFVDVQGVECQTIPEPRKKIKEERKI